MEALDETMTGHLPPSSSVTGTRFSAAALITRRATAPPPVKSRWSNGRLAKACATSGPPLTTAISDGSKTDEIMRSVKADEAGLNSEGRIMTRLPAATIPASGAKVRLKGKFHGLMTPTTPGG